MKRVFLTSAIFILTLAQSALSEVIVKSTSHTNFDRLIVYLPVGQSWEIQEDKNVYTVKTPGLGLDFKTENIFDSISRSRIREVNGGNNILDIELSCECRVIPNQLASGQLVLDIFGSKSTLNLDSDSINKNRFLKVRPVKEESISREIGSDIRELRNRIMKDLGKSISLSILQKVENLPQINQDMRQPELNIFNQLRPSERIQLYNSIQEAREKDSARKGNNSLQNCPASDYFKISDWFEEEDFSANISETRLNIIDELGIINQGRAENLVRAYLFFGLTEEARSILSLFEIDTLSKRYLEGITSIMENSAVVEDIVFKELFDCRGSIVPWLVLSNPTQANLSSDQRKDLVLEVSSWPNEVLTLLGPRIISILNKREYETTASIVDAIFSRIESDENVQSFRLSSLPSPELYTIAKSGKNQSAEALATYIERSIKLLGSITQEDIELLEAYEFEFQELPISNTLREQRLLAYAYLGKMESLLSFLNQLQKYEDPIVARSIEEILTLSIERNHPIQAILVSNFILKEKLISKLDSNKKKLAFDTLMSAGLVSLSKDLIGSDLAGSQLDTISSQMALKEYNTELLSNINYTRISKDTLESVVTYLLNANAIEAVPPQIFEDLPSHLQNRVAFTMKDWPTVEGSGLEARFADAISASLEKTSTSQPLASARELVATSISGRQVIEDALNLPIQ